MNSWLVRTLFRNTLAIVVIALACEHDGHATPCSTPDGSTPDVWVVSTRRLPEICRMPFSAHPIVERLNENNCWERSDLASLLSDPTQPLIVFVHGNRYKPSEAHEQGVLLAKRSAACCPNAPSVRTVIFSWPSEQDGILLRDGRAKYDRAFTEGHYLAWLLGRVEPERPVAIVGYSFGGFIAMEALEDLAAEEKAGRTDFQPWINRPGQLNVVLVAAALRCDALAPRGPYHEALECVDRLILINNSSDKVLRFYPFLERTNRAQALGYVGMPGRWASPHLEFAQINAAPIVGKHHRFQLYLHSPSLSKRICNGATADFVSP